MIYHVSAKARRGGDGSEKRPFKRISDAAALAHAGDTVLVGPGLYREYVDPVRGGTEDAPIRYVSAEPLGAIISGAEEVKCWEPYAGNVYVARIQNGVFGGYNPYTTKVAGDWFHATTGVHTGEVYLNGRAMYEVQSIEAVQAGEVITSSWEPEYSMYQWYTEQEDGSTVIYANFQGKDPNAENVEINVRRNCFYPSKTGVSYITLSGFTVKQAATQWAPPTAYQEGMVGPHWAKGWIIEDCEISDSRCSGISLGKYLQPNNENKWSTLHYKNGTQTERDAICQAQAEGWSKENIGSHIIRRCNIHDCGQTGIVGHLGGVFSVIEDNHIHHINNKQDLLGAEIGGIKMHAAIDVIIRRNDFHNCTRGLWLDWQAQGTRVSQNLFHDNVAPVGAVPAGRPAFGEDLFVEVSHGPTLIDNNIFLSPVSVRFCAQGVALVHNLIAGSFTNVGAGTDNAAAGPRSARYTPYHMVHRTEVAGFMTFLHGDDRLYNNIFVQQAPREDIAAAVEAAKDSPVGRLNLLCGTKPFDGYPTPKEYFDQFRDEVFQISNRAIYYDHLPVYSGGNVYFNGAQPYDKEKDFAVAPDCVRLALQKTDEGYRLDTDLYEHLPAVKTSTISTELLGKAFEPEELFENPDGTPIIFDRDYLDEKRGINPIPGPFACASSAQDLL